MNKLTSKVAIDTGAPKGTGSTIAKALAAVGNVPRAAEAQNMTPPLASITRPPSRNPTPNAGSAACA